MTPKSTDRQSNGNGNRIWWVELLRREGILVTLVIAYATFIAFPESQARREALEKSQSVMERVAEAVQEIRVSESIQAQAALEVVAFRRQVEADHRQQATDHEKQITRLDAIGAAVQKNSGPGG